MNHSHPPSTYPGIFSLLFLVRKYLWFDSNCALQESHLNHRKKFKYKLGAFLYIAEGVPELLRVIKIENDGSCGWAVTWWSGFCFTVGSSILSPIMQAFRLLEQWHNHPCFPPHPMTLNCNFYLKENVKF